jgi:hypothetical protein
MSTNVCADCSGQCRDCCHLKPGTEPVKFGLTINDMQRISKATGLRPSEYADYEKIHPLAKHDMAAVAPGIDRMFPRNIRVGLKFDEKTRACFFWKAGKGCILDKNTRPRICTLFPAWYAVDGTGKVAIEPMALSNSIECLAIERAKSQPKKTLKVFNTSETQLAHFAKLYEVELTRHSQASDQEIAEAYLVTANISSLPDQE